MGSFDRTSAFSVGVAGGGASGFGGASVTFLNADDPPGASLDTAIGVGGFGGGEVHTGRVAICPIGPEMLAKNLGILKEHISLAVSEQLTPYEVERIDSFSDEELAEWNRATAVIQRLVHPQEEIIDVTPTTRSLTA